MAMVGKRARRYRVAGHRPAGMGLRTPEAARWWQVRKRRRQRPGARRVERGGGWDWGKFAAGVTSFTAIAALLFTGLSLQQTREQNQLAESGQITDRFNAAVTNLGSGSETIRIGGVYALQRIMQDSPRDQPAIIQVLAAFIRQQAPWNGSTSDARRAASADQEKLELPGPAPDVQAALTVLGSRDPADDGGVHVELQSTDLLGAELSGADLAGADFFGANLALVDFTGANLSGVEFGTASLAFGFISNANLTDADLSDADLTGVDLSGADLIGAALDIADLTGANLTNSLLAGADLWGTIWCSGEKPLRPGGYVCNPDRF